MPKVFCSICKEDYELKNIRVSLCGHGYCISCDSQTKACPTCRRPKLLDQSIRLYLTFTDDLSPEECAQNAIDRLSKLNANVPAERMKPFAESLRATVNESNGELLTSLIRDFEESMLQPAYTELEHSKEECSKLRNRLRQTENAEKLVNDLQVQLHKVKKERQEARVKCRALQDGLDSSQVNISRLSRRIDRMKCELEQANTECQRLEVQSAKHDQEVSLLKRKLRAVAKSTRRTHQDDDALLIVTPRPEQPSGTGPEQISELREKSWKRVRTT